MKKQMLNFHYSILPYNHFGIRTVPFVDEDGEIYFNVYASKKVKGNYEQEILILKISENDEKCEARWDNLRFGYLCGWRVDYPNDPSGFGDRKVGLGDMIKTSVKEMPNISCIQVDYLGEMEILEPRLKYLIRALESKKLALTIKHIKFYRQYPNEVEMLIKTGNNYLVSNSKIYKLKAETKKKLMAKLSKSCGQNLNDLLYEIKHGIPSCLVENHRKLSKEGIKDSKGLAKYIENLEIENVRLYKDYLEMCKEANKDIKDSYWAFPKDLRERHDKLLSERDRVKRANLESEFTMIAEVSNELRKKYEPLIIDGYEIDFPKDVLDIADQARELSQCLLTANYHKKYSNNQLMLVFIKRNDKRIATVEIEKNMKIGQFYADESDREDCLPSHEVEEAFYEWYKKSMKGIPCDTN